MDQGYPQVGKKKGQIEIEKDMLYNAINALNDSVISLSSILVPILQPESPVKEEKDNPDCIVSLAGEIRESRCRIIGIKDRIENIISRIEL